MGKLHKIAFLEGGGGWGNFLEVIFLGGNFLGGNFPAGKFLGGNFPGGNFPGGIFNRTLKQCFFGKVAGP